MLQFPCKPMKCKKTQEEWEGLRIAEMKKDGDRTFAVRRGSERRLYSSIGTDVTAKYPEIIEALDNSLLSDDFDVDGEIVSVDESWESLHKRSDSGESNSSVYYSIFDVLRVEGKNLASTPLVERKKALSLLVDNTPHIKNMPFELMTFKEAKQFFQKEVDEGKEGIVVKDPNSIYQPGSRNKSWIKMKRGDALDCHVIGLTKSDKDGRLFGAIVLATSAGFYLGKAGTGFTEAEALEIVETVHKNLGSSHITLPNSVRREIAVECKPLWCKITFQEYTGSNSIRHPVWAGFRSDPALKGKT